jgi:hypothetical protein
MKTTLFSTAISLLSFTSFGQKIASVTTSVDNISSVSESTSLVKYSSFDALLTGKTVTCNWVTEQEINHNYFELESSFDGTNFKTAAIIFGQEGNSSIKQSYQFKDKNAALKMNDVVYYRLKQIDNDGYVQYSNPVKLKLKETIVSELAVVPSPFANNLTYTFQAPANGFVISKIINLGGRNMLTKHSAVTKGTNSLQIDELDNFSKGLYIIEVTMNGNVIGRQKINKG